MEVILDGERSADRADGYTDLLEFLAAVSDELQANNRALMSVSVDGRVLEPRKVAEEAACLGIDCIALLELTSEDVSVMVERTLASLHENLPELPAACRSLAEVFQGENPSDGYEPFERLAEIWEFIKNQERLVANALGLKVGELQINGVSLENMHTELNGFLEEAAQALESRDCVLLGDLLEYELAPRAEREADIVAVLAAHQNGPTTAP